MTAPRIPATPVLFPRRQRRSGMNVTARALARFIHTYGFWPRSLELARFLHANPHAMPWYLTELIRDGWVERATKARSAHGVRYALSAAGWKMLGVRPIAPYMPAPTARSRAAITATIARKVVRAIATGEPINA